MSSTRASFVVTCSLAFVALLFLVQLTLGREGVSVALNGLAGVLVAMEISREADRRYEVDP